MSDIGEPYLILHKVRNAPAFDIAEKVHCTHCDGSEDDICQCNWHRDGKPEPCHICDGKGFFWMIPTSGHSAHPSWWMPLDRITVNPDNRANIVSLAHAIGIPTDWPDHYACNNKEPKGVLYHTTARELLKQLGLGEPAMKRRKLG